MEYVPLSLKSDCSLTKYKNVCSEIRGYVDDEALSKRVIELWVVIDPPFLVFDRLVHI